MATVINSLYCVFHRVLFGITKFLTLPPREQIKRDLLPFAEEARATCRFDLGCFVFDGGKEDRGLITAAGDIYEGGGGG